MRIPLSKPGLRCIRRTYENRNDPANPSSDFGSQKGSLTLSMFSPAGIFGHHENGRSYQQDLSQSATPGPADSTKTPGADLDSFEPDSDNDQYVRQDLGKKTAVFCFHVPSPRARAEHEIPT